MAFAAALRFKGPVASIITAACYEHKHLIVRNAPRMANSEKDRLTALASDQQLRLVHSAKPLSSLGADRKN
jgi:hypothetical protein